VKRTSLFAVFALMLMLASCRHAYVNQKLDPDGSISGESAGGYLPPKQHLQVQSQQISVNNKRSVESTIQTATGKMNEALEAGDIAKAREYQELILSWGGTNTGVPSIGMSTMVKIRNTTNQLVQVTSPPFYNLWLGGGETSRRAYLMPTGGFSVQFGLNNGQYYKRRDITYYIKTDTQFIDLYDPY
jgi:hypothetical protein